MLIERGTLKYQKGVAISDLIDETDIEEIFTVLGGGTQYRIGAGSKTVLEWWKDGSDTGVQSDRNFNRRLTEFNKRIAYLADNNPEMLVSWVLSDSRPRVDI